MYASYTLAKILHQVKIKILKLIFSKVDFL